MSEIKDRLLEFLRYKKLGQQKFEISIGMSNGWANKVGDSIRESSLRKIKETYPELNILWLKSGVGNMLVGDSEETLDNEPNNEREETRQTEDPGVAAKLVYLLPIAAQGGSLNDFVMSVKEGDCEKIISPVKDADFAMPVCGDSMAPEYPNGSQILIKKINEKAFIVWGNAYVLDTCNGTIIKKLFPGRGENRWLCKSINPDYPDFEVDVKDVFGVYRVILCMSIK